MLDQFQKSLYWAAALPFLPKNLAVGSSLWFLRASFSRSSGGQRLLLRRERLHREGLRHPLPKSPNQRLLLRLERLRHPLLKSPKMGATITQSAELTDSPGANVYQAGRDIIVEQQPLQIPAPNVARIRVR